MISYKISHLRREGHREPHNEFMSPNPGEHLLGSELGTFQLCHNALTHLATLPRQLSLGHLGQDFDSKVSYLIKILSLWVCEWF